MSAVPIALVLYVEDEPLIRELSALILEEAGFEVLMVPDGAAAIDALDRNAPPISIVITDVTLGDGPDGWEVARHARALNHAMPIIYVSGGSSHEWHSRGVPNSVMIAKPFTDVQIVDTISSLLKATDSTQANS
jgi:DNA-binding response OmpR family regulator